MFRSKAAGEILMFAESARRIFAILGKEEAPRGVITAAQVGDALERLVAAVENERAELKAARERNELSERLGDGTGTSTLPPITLGQRAFPLIEMLRSAQKRHVDVTWGV
ncbi:MAG TPA: DUF1840 domain-containing protein [Burkholderiaceae bacterium]